MKRIFFLLFFLLLITSSIADDGLTVVAIGKATLEKEKISFAGNHGGFKSDYEKLLDIIKNDFAFYKNKFEVSVAKNAGYEMKIDLSSVKNSTTLLSATFEILKVSTNRKILEEKIQFSRANLIKTAHQISELSYRAIVGKKAIFNSFIVFTSDKISSGDMTLKELYKMDYDGRNVERLTFHNSNVISPAISPDNRYIVYSMIKNIKDTKHRNIDLYHLDTVTKQSVLLLSKRGINSGAVYMPDGKNIVVTLTYLGNAELYIYNLETRALRRLTNHYAIDVDPSVSGDGRIIAFLSSRPGKAMIYTLDTSGMEKSVRRISYVGQYNATPRFSPAGAQIAFSSWVDDRFDIYRIGANGTDLVRLTKDFGSNEDPVFSGDGEFIAFSSQRVISRIKAVQNIYVMTKDGEIIRSLTQNEGNCITPRWSN